MKTFRKNTRPDDSDLGERLGLLSFILFLLLTVFISRAELFKSRSRVGDENAM